MKNLMTFIIMLMSVSMFSQMGELDDTFGDSGIVTTSVNSEDIATVELILTADDKILSACNIGEFNSRKYLVMQQNADGLLDQSFGENGLQIISLSSSTDECRFMKTDSSGNIYIGGTGFEVGEFNNFKFTRLNANGIVDITFGENGTVSQDFFLNNDSANDIDFQKDGKIVVAGYSVIDGDLDFLVARFNENGQLDATFNNLGYFSIDFDDNADDARYLRVKEDGKIMVFGVSAANSSSVISTKIIQLNSDGSLDQNFGDDGVITIQLSNSLTAPRGIEILDGGKVLIGCQIGSKDFGLIKLNGNGSFDLPFGDGGMVRHTITSAPINTSQEFIIQNNKKIIICGFSGSFPDYQTCLFRLNPDGGIDSTFAENGVALNNISDSTNLWTDIINFSENRIIVSGYANNSTLYNHALGKFIIDINVGIVDANTPIKEILVYPNPISKRSYLEYSLEEGQNIEITLMNQNGMIIQQVLPSSKRERGKHSEIVELKLDLSSGIYFLVMKGSNFTQMVRITKI